MWLNKPAKVLMSCVLIYNSKLTLMLEYPVFSRFSAHTKNRAEKRGQYEVFGPKSAIFRSRNVTQLWRSNQNERYRLAIFACVFLVADHFSVRSYGTFIRADEAETSIVASLLIRKELPLGSIEPLLFAYDFLVPARRNSKHDQ